MKTARMMAIGVVVSAMAAAPAAAAGAPKQRSYSQTVHQGSLRAQFTFRGFPGATWWGNGRIRIWKSGRLLVNRSTFNGPMPAFRHNKTVPDRGVFIRQLDGTGPPEVMLNLWSGGAHCCSETWIFTGAHVAKRIWGHMGPPTLRDADGDGQPEFHGLDTSFAYLFGSFASSRFPAKVWSYASGRINDVTRSFPAEVQADMAQQYSSYQECLTSEDQGDYWPSCVRGALAAYAADGYSLGQGDQAMAVVQQAVDAGQTSTATDSFDDFLGKLQQVLHEGGYA